MTEDDRLLCDELAWANHDVELLRPAALGKPRLSLDMIAMIDPNHPPARGAPPRILEALR